MGLIDQFFDDITKLYEDDMSQNLCMIDVF